MPKLGWMDNNIGPGPPCWTQYSLRNWSWQRKTRIRALQHDHAIIGSFEKGLPIQVSCPKSEPSVLEQKNPHTILTPLPSTSKSTTLWFRFSHGHRRGYRRRKAYLVAGMAGLGYKGSGPIYGYTNCWGFEGFRERLRFPIELWRQWWKTTGKGLIFQRMLFRF